MDLEMGDLSGIGEEGDSDDKGGDGNQELLYVNLKTFVPKDILLEERSSRDLQGLLGREDGGPILLDPHINTTYELIELFLDRLIEQDYVTDALKTEVLGNMFTHPSWPLLTRCIYHSTTEKSGEENPDPFLITMVDSPNIETRHAAFARLPHFLNTGRGNVRFVIFVITPTRSKGTKDAFETASTFGTIMADPEFRLKLEDSPDIAHTRNLFMDFGAELQDQIKKESSSYKIPPHHSLSWSGRFMGGLIGDVRRRLPWYLSDITEGFVGHKNLQKTIAASVFLFMIGLLPSVAFGVLADRNTDGLMGVEKMIYAQGVAGLGFSLFSGQPLVILDTTAPIALYIKLIYEIAKDSEVDFFGLYAWVGIWNAIFLILYAVFEAGVLIKYSTPWVEETFAFFIALAFTVDALHPLGDALSEYYYDCDDDRYCNNLTHDCCDKDQGLLWIMLLFSTAMVGVLLYNVRDSIFFTPLIREYISDYSLFLSVIIVSFFGSYVFKNTEMEAFPRTNGSPWSFAPLGDMPGWTIGASAGLGFTLSLLFFMDQNIRSEGFKRVSNTPSSSAIVNAPANKLRKGHAYHLDLAVVGIINGILSMFGLPWLHGALPHSPLHVRVLADHEVVYCGGHITERVVHVRETRVSSFIANAAILLAVLCVPTPLDLIPVPVLYGVFLTLAVTSLFGNSLWDRILLFFTQQTYYPPSHYLRRVPQKIVHLYTLFQLCFVGLLSFFGFFPEVYIQILLPVIIILELPVRHFVIPRLFRKDYLLALDGDHH